MRRINMALAILVLVIGLPWYWLLIDNRPGDAAAKPVSMAQLRQLAASIPGPAPSAVEMESPAYRRLPRALFAAGTGIKRTQIGVVAFRLPVPGGKAVMIDSGLTPEDAQAMGMEFYSAPIQQRIDAALASAGTILITHEHQDHQGALVRLGGRALTEAARLNPAQLPPAPLAAALRWKDRPVPAAGIAPGAPSAAAPGVVVIPAPSHTPGSQMIFVRLADGHEFLFAGDIATLDTNWRQLRARSRLVGDYIAPEDRAEVYAWLQTIRALQAQAPDMVVVPGHDLTPLRYGPRAKLFVKGFSDR